MRHSVVTPLMITTIKQVCCTLPYKERERPQKRIHLRTRYILRTAPMNTLDNIEELESSIPVVLKEPVKHTLAASAEA